MVRPAGWILSSGRSPVPMRRVGGATGFRIESKTGLSSFFFRFFVISFLRPLRPAKFYKELTKLCKNLNIGNDPQLLIVHFHNAYAGLNYQV